MPNKVNHGFNALLKVPSIKSRSFSLIRLCGNVVYIVEKSCVDKLVVWNPLHFNLLSTSPEFLLTKTNFYLMFHTLSHSILIAVRQEVNNLESSVVEQELEFTIILALYGLL